MGYAVQNRALVDGKQKFVAKGHDAILKVGQDAGSSIQLTFMGSSEIIIGTLVNRDKFTITIEFESGNRETFYKHAIKSFKVIKAAR